MSLNIDDVINSDINHEEILSQFKQKYFEQIKQDFDNKNYCKILVYTLKNNEPALIYSSKGEQNSRILTEVTKIAELIEKENVKDYVFIIGLYEGNFITNKNQLTEDQKIQREKMIISPCNKKVKEIRKEFWNYIKEKSKKD